MRTTRERIADLLREDELTPSEIATAVAITPEQAIEDVQHLARSLESGNEELLVAPPRCEDCGFAAFDDPANRPSRCPECKGESIVEPAFTIR